MITYYINSSGELYVQLNDEIPYLVEGVKEFPIRVHSKTKIVLLFN